jgi:hypothetical protein
MLHHIVSYKLTNVSEVLTAFIKRAASQKAVIFILTAVRT